MMNGVGFKEPEKKREQLALAARFFACVRARSSSVLAFLALSMGCMKI